MTLHLPQSVFAAMYVWNDDTSVAPANMVTWDPQNNVPRPVRNFMAIERELTLSQAYTYAVTAFLTDMDAQNIVAGNYFELYLGNAVGNVNTYPPAAFGAGTGMGLWIAGYVVSVELRVEQQNAYTIHGASASIYLADTTDCGYMEMLYPHYQDVGDAINGNPANSNNPHEKGILSGSGFQAVKVPGTWAWPGHGDSWRQDSATRMANLVALQTHYNFYGREGDDPTNPGSPSKRYSGSWEVGPLEDDANFEIWAGDDLQAQLNTDYGYVLEQPNAALAQMGVDGSGHNDLGASIAARAVINTVTYMEDAGHMINVIYPYGFGEGTLMVTLKSLWPKPPDEYGVLMTPAFPNQEEFYLGDSVTSPSGKTFQLCARRENEPKFWDYGVCDPDSVTANGQHHMTLSDKKIHGEKHLLSRAIGTLEFNSDATPTWSFEVYQPLVNLLEGKTLPAYPKPGQKITVHYTGVVNAMRVEEDDTSPDWGQFVDVGEYKYLTFPNLPNGDPRINKVERVISFHDALGGGTYRQEITTGKGQWHSRWESWHLAGKLMDLHHHGGNAKHHFKRGEFAGVHIWLSENPDAEETGDGNLILHTGAAGGPGAIAVTVQKHARTFQDHSAFQFDVQMNDPANVLRFWLNKPPHHYLTSAVTNQDGTARNYALFQMSGTGAPAGTGFNSGFFSTTDDSTMNPLGKTLPNRLLDANNRFSTGHYRVNISWDGGTWQVYVMTLDPQFTDTLAGMFEICRWNDRVSQPGGKMVTEFGAIGWYCYHGSQPITISDVHFRASVMPPVRRALTHPHITGSHHWHSLQCYPTAWSDITHQATFQLAIYGSVFELMRNNGQRATNEDVSSIFGSTIPGPDTFTAYLDDWVIYNGTTTNITDSLGNHIVPKSFGAVPVVYSDYFGHDDVYVLGRVSNHRDKATGLPWVYGWQHGHLKWHGLHYQDGSLLKNHHHYAVQFRHTLHNLQYFVRKHSSLDAHKHPQGFCAVRFRLTHHDHVGHITTEDGTVAIANRPAQSGPIDIYPFQAGNILVWNPPRIMNSDGSISVSNLAIDSTSLQQVVPGVPGAPPMLNGYPLLGEENCFVVVIAKLSDHVDKHTHDYYFHPWHPASWQHPGHTVGKGSVGRGGQHPHHPSKKKRKKPKNTNTTQSGLVHHHVP